LEAADRGEVSQPEPAELDRLEREDELEVGAALGNTN
jgi:hypothetical protein